MPTHKTAESNDYLYKYVRKKEYEKYWTVIAKLLNLDLSDISEDFFHLVTTMIKYDYKKRFTIDEIKDHPWMKGEIATEEEVRKELASRKVEIKKKLGDDDDTDIDDLDANIDLEQIERGDEEDWTEDEVNRKIKVYNPEFPSMTEFFSKFKPDVLLFSVYNFCKDTKLEFKLSKEEYSCQVQMASEDENIVDFSVEILKHKADSEVDMGDEDTFVDAVEDDDDDDTKYCVVFRKKRGPKQDFIKIFKQFRFFSKKLNNTE